MSTPRFTQEQRWDHARDLRKHDTPPLPDRLNKPLTTAMDIVVLVKGMDNYAEAASLVEKYAAMVAAGAALDEGQRVADRILGAFEVPNV